MVFTRSGSERIRKQGKQCRNFYVADIGERLDLVSRKLDPEIPRFLLNNSFVNRHWVICKSIISRVLAGARALAFLAILKAFRCEA